MRVTFEWQSFSASVWRFPKLGYSLVMDVVSDAFIENIQRVGMVKGAGGHNTRLDRRHPDQMSRTIWYLRTQGPGASAPHTTIRHDSGTSQAMGISKLKIVGRDKCGEKR